MQKKKKTVKKIKRKRKTPAEIAAARETAFEMVKKELVAHLEEQKHRDFVLPVNKLTLPEIIGKLKVEEIKPFLRLLDRTSPGEDGTCR